MRYYEIIDNSNDSVVGYIYASSLAEARIIAQSKGYGSGYRVEVM